MARRAVTVTLPPGRDLPVRVLQTGEDTTEDDDRRLSQEYLDGIDEAVRQALAEIHTELAMEFAGYRDSEARDDQGQWSGGGGSGRIGGVHDGVTVEMATAAVATTLANRVRNDIATAGTGPIAQANLKRLLDSDPDLRAVGEGDPAATARMAEALAKANNYGPSTNPAQRAKVRQVVDSLADNPVMAAAVKRFGSVEIAVVHDPGAAAEYVRNYMVVSDTAGHPLGPNDPLGVAGPLHHNAFTFDNSLTGAIRHEYGHHVQSMLSTADAVEWGAAIRTWGGVAGMDGMKAVARLQHKTTPAGYWELTEDQSAGMSLYARTNAREAFAETFNAVTHPDFDIANVPAAGRPLVDAMLKILKGKP